MYPAEKLTFLGKAKAFFIGKARNPLDPELFQNLSLAVFLAWIGLGSDGLTSSCYGPEESFLALGHHPALGIFVALASVFTIFVISSSYAQIISLFPGGGGGYLVASKLLTPSIGMVSGCALLIDYVLTITLSIAAGADALFSFFPPGVLALKLPFAVAILVILIILNLRGVKESVEPLIPIFLAFIITHVFVIVYGLVHHLGDFGNLVSSTSADLHQTQNQLGLVGMFLLIMRAYSMGAGTYTGIEAVSNGMSILREPKVKTAHKTMFCMAASLAFLVLGLTLGYLLYKVSFTPGKTLNAVLFESITNTWSQPWGRFFVLITLLSEAVLLFAAAQTGFLGGPRVLANMAQDRWFPVRFAILSERFVTQNGILIMGIGAVILMLASRGSVKFLVVLYSINVFITFLFSQLGMVKHWWMVRSEDKQWLRKILVNGIGLVLTVFILISMVVLKFFEGGWITMFITGSLIALCFVIKHHYNSTGKLLKRLDNLIEAANIASTKHAKSGPVPIYDPKSKTAVILVSGYNGAGLHTLFNVIKIFGGDFRNFFFIQAGIIDAGNFKGSEELAHLQKHVSEELKQYEAFMRSQGFYAQGFSAVGTDVIKEVEEEALKIFHEYPKAVFFAGQVVFPQDTFFTPILHNYTTFAIQKKLYHQGIPLLIMPIRVMPDSRQSSS